MLPCTRRRTPPVPLHIQAWNLEALDSLIRLTRQDGVALIVYKAPHRPGDGQGAVLAVHADDVVDQEVAPGKRVLVFVDHAPQEERLAGQGNLRLGKPLEHLA